MMQNPQFTLQSVSSRCIAMALAGCAALLFVETAAGQVVQLPSVRNFSYTGSASIPDAGTGSLGGVRYSSSRSSTRGWGPFAGRSAGNTAGGVSLSASVQIIDLKALDDAILASNVSQDSDAASIVSAGSPAVDGQRNYLSGLSQGPYAGSGQSNPDPGQWQRALSGGGLSNSRHTSLVEADIRYYLQRGKEAEQANHVNSARVYYRLAVDAMTPEMVERYHRILAEREKAEEEQKATDKPQANRQQF